MPLPEPVTVEPLSPEHDRTTFASGSGPLDRYLQRQAGQDIRRDFARVYVAAVGASTPRLVAAYYTLNAASLRPTEIPENVGRRLPRYDQIPAVMLGRLAVDGRHQRSGLGRFMLFDAFARVIDLAEQVGVFAVVVDAIDDRARMFYERNGFRLCRGAARTLFVPVGSIRPEAP